MCLELLYFPRSAVALIHAALVAMSPICDLLFPDVFLTTLPFLARVVFLPGLESLPKVLGALFSACLAGLFFFLCALVPVN